MLVSLGDLLEPRVRDLRICPLRRLVRMRLLCHLFVRRLDRVGRGISFHPQDLVVIAFHFRRVLFLLLFLLLTSTHHELALQERSHQEKPHESHHGRQRSQRSDADALPQPPPRKRCSLVGLPTPRGPGGAAPRTPRLPFSGDGFRRPGV